MPTVSSDFKITFRGYFRADETSLPIKDISMAGGLVVESTVKLQERKAAPETRRERKLKFKQQVEEKRRLKKESLENTGETHLGQPAQGWIQGITSSVCTLKDQAMKGLKTLTATFEPVNLDSTSPKENQPKATA